MKLLFGYTMDYIKRNKRSSAAIMIAILMTSTMMSALCGFLYNVQMDSINYILKETGNWHGELFDDTKASHLEKLNNINSIESIMIKGQWKVAQIANSRRDYLVWRDANTEYWNSMPEGDTAILEGRAPTKSDEIALSKQYFEQYPELKLGDSLTLPIGNRTASDGSVIAPQDLKQEGESFVQTGTVTLSVVGKLDFTTSSTTPAYTALGYLEPSTISPQDDLVIYFRFFHVQDTYKELPKIAKEVGYEPDEYGNYVLRYNVDYLARLGIFDPAQIDLATLLTTGQTPLVFLVIGLLVVALFVFIIHNAFTLSSLSRITQLGVFSSVGATPKQIKRSVVLEAMLLTVIPLPIGLFLGQLAVGGLIRYSNQFGTLGDRDLMQFSVGLLSVLPAIILTLLTVFWSALIPARKISRMSPIVAIRQGGAEKLKKRGRFSRIRLEKVFGLSGELAANALHARRKSYRTATISLTLSFLIFSGFWCINTASTASMSIYKTSEKQWAKQDITLSLYNVTEQQDLTAIQEKIKAQKTIKTDVWYSTQRTAVWIPEENGFSPEFEKKGGFPAIEKKMSSAQTPLLRDGQRRVGITLLGLDDHTFATYCAQLGIDPAPFYEETNPKGILYHTVSDITTGSKRNPVEIPFLNIREGTTLTLTEKYNDSREGEYTFDMEVAAIAEKMPPIGGSQLGARYSAVQIMPMEQINRLTDHFAQKSTMKVTGIIQVSNPSQIRATRTDMEEICESYYGSGDYELFDEEEYNTREEAGRETTNMMFSFIAVLFAVIGLSNAWATVRGIIHARRREFAMLRSIGLPPKGVKKLLILEALMLGGTPLVVSLPVVFALQALFLSINEVSFIEWLPFAPWLQVLGYIAAITMTMILAYVTAGRKVMDENIIEAIKMDSI